MYVFLCSHPHLCLSLIFANDSISPFAKCCPATFMLDKAPPVVGSPRRAHVYSLPVVPVYVKLFFYTLDA